MIVFRSIAIVTAFLTVSSAWALPDFRTSTCREAKVKLEDLNQVSDPTHYDLKEFTKWMPSTAGAARRVTLVVHGLNVKPSRMDSLANIFQEAGSEVLRISFSGHRGNLDEMRQVTSEAWLNQAFFSYCLAFNRAQELGVPLVLAAFSLGALVYEDLLSYDSIRQPITFQQAVLLAPAISLAWKASFVKALRIFGSSFIVPSFNFEEYRANEGSSVAAYDALFELKDHLEEQAFKNSGIPTLVIAEPDDELVSFGGIEDLIQDLPLPNWKLMKTTAENTVLPSVIHHLIIDEPAVGKEEWLKIKKAIQAALNPRVSLPSLTH